MYYFINLISTLFSWLWIYLFWENNPNKQLFKWLSEGLIFYNVLCFFMFVIFAALLMVLNISGSGLYKCSNTKFQPGQFCWWWFCLDRQQIKTFNFKQIEKILYLKMHTVSFAFLNLLMFKLMINEEIFTWMWNFKKGS